uniref:Uncharacterized protein n=1 Tax=Acrobeloides nanus TaxID=290746 RepID=A0A914EMK8_9BILA
MPAKGEEGLVHVWVGPTQARAKTMVDYLIRVIGLATLMNWMNWAFQNLANIMPTLMDIFQSLLNQAAWCALMIPIGEFFTTFLWIEMYREQYIWLLSCGRFYKDKIGQNLTKQPIRATTMVIEPRQSFLIANPGTVAPTNGGWADPVLQAALNTDLNAKFIPVSNIEMLQQNWTSNGQDSRKGDKYSFTNLNQLDEEN